MNRSTFAPAVLLVPVLLLATGCTATDDSPTSSDPAAVSTASLKDDCAAYARAMVAKQAECPTEMIHLDTRDSAVAGLASSCEALFGAPGSDAAGPKMQACTAAVAAASCVEFHAGLEDCLPMFRGTLADAAECIFDNQCESGVCNGFSSSSCGHCTPRAQTGETCGIGANDRLCAEGLVCLAASETQGTCEPVTARRPGVGSPCERASDCQNDWLTCDPKKGKCVERGSVCASTVSALNYDCAASQTCTSDGECVDGAWVAPGEACDPYQGVFCSPSLYCGEGNVCRSRIGEGGACDGTTTGQCAAGLSCLSGTCTAPSLDRYVCSGEEQGGGGWFN